MRHILERIQERKVHFEMVAGSKPRCVYVGEEEYRELRDMEGMRPLLIKPNDGRRPEALGLLVFQVDSPAHLEVSS